jgi:hypothetical protein
MNEDRSIKREKKGIEVLPDLWKDFTLRAVQLDLKLYEAIEQAIECWLIKEKGEEFNKPFLVGSPQAIPVLKRIDALLNEDPAFGRTLNACMDMFASGKSSTVTKTRKNH